jgi:hypothetical protein
MFLASNRFFGVFVIYWLNLTSSQWVIFPKNVHFFRVKLQLFEKVGSPK